MTTDVREAAIAALHARLSAIPGVGLCRRTIAYPVEYAKLPAIIVMDGNEDVERNQNTLMQVSTTADVLVAVRAPHEDSLGTTLNRWRAEVIAAVGEDITLGGAVSDCLYHGCGDPVVDVMDADPTLATLPLRFVLTRWEAEGDPYST